MADVAYESVSRTYPGASAPALEALELAIDDGEFMVLVGPSGSGKTTALRLLAGLDRVSAGQIRVGGRDVTNVSPKERDIAMVFQNYALYPHKNVADNMGFALKMRGVPKGERAKRVRAAAKLLDIEELLDRKPRELSGGQRQRVAMGRAIVREPQVFLMDEPLSNLDAKLRVQTRSQIAELQQRLGVTTVYVTHDQVEAMTMGNRVAVLNNGQLQQCASPRALYDEPANVFVAGFIGSPAMNLLSASLNGSGANVGGAVLPLARWFASATWKADVGTITVGLRPEHLRIDPNGAMEGKVGFVEELGADAFVHVTVGGGDDGVNLLVRVDGRRPPAQHEKVRLSVDPEEVHLFHPDTGERLRP